MIRLLRPTVAASLAILAFACNPKGAAPPTCTGTVCNVAGVPTCIDITTDASNCGACANKCAAPTGGTVACSAGACVTSCSAPNNLACNGKCTDKNADHDNCSACGVTCGAQQQCVAATCTSVSTTQCTVGGPPVNLATDPANCGSCGHACASGQSCNSGVCTSGTCPAGSTICPAIGSGAAYCSVVATDKNNCGNCGNVCPTPSGATGGAAGVRCFASVCQDDCGGGFTSSTKLACNNTCTDISTDHDNCGTTAANACGHVCGAQQKCVSGACTNVTTTQCTPGAPQVDLSSDPNNCGGCATGQPGDPHKCATGQVCLQGLCSVGTGPTSCASPPSSATQCKNTVPAYCTTTSSDVNNCGACGNVCAANEVCKAGDCDPCPITQCNNVCTDTLHDPKNCGSCGTVANYCENGTPLTGIAIELTPPFSATGPSFAAANNALTPVTVKVHSQLRVVNVTFKTAPAGSACNASPVFGTAVGMGLPGQFEVQPSVWFANIPSPMIGTQFAIQFDAYDEQYQPSRADAAAHTVSQCVTATILVVPTATATNITAAAGALALGAGAACGGKTCMWVPLNGPAITLSAQVPGAASNNIARIEFRNANVAGSIGGSSTLCPSSLPTAAPPPVVTCSQPVDGTGIAKLTLAAAEIGKGDVTIYACPVDAAGQYTATCTQMPFPSVCGVAGTVGCLFNFTIGRIAIGGSRPVIGKNADATNTRTIYYTAFNDPGTNVQPSVFAQDYAQLNSTTTNQPGARVGTNLYFLDSLFATAEGSGTFAVRSPNTLGQVDRIDCPTIATTGCLKVGFVTSPGGSFRQVHGATGGAMLVSDSIPGTNFGGAAFYATAAQSQTTAVAVAMGTLLQVASINGTSNPTTSPQFGTTTSGAIVAWFNNAGTVAPAIFHPNLPGNHVVTLPMPAPGPSLSSFDLLVSPAGEIVYQFATDTNLRFLGAAYYDGTATPPKTLAPFLIGPSGSTVLAKNFITASTGVLLGEMPSAIDNTKFQAVEINLFAGTGTAAAKFTPIPYDVTTTGTFHEGGVFSRLGFAGNFTVSDDKSKALFVTDDPNPAAGSVNPLWRVHLLDLATGIQTSLFASERLLCANTSVIPALACNLLSSGARHYPRFVHSAPVYVGAAPAGLHQVVIWEEELPTLAGNTFAIRHARISFATFSGGGAPALASIDRLNTYSTGMPTSFATEIESAAGGSIYFLSVNDQGGADLYSVPLTPPAANPVAASKVIDRVFAFKVREDKGRMLVVRADGTVYFAQLPGGGANPSSALTLIANSGQQDDVLFNGAGKQTYGFTPDGDHAWVILDGPLGIQQGILETVDLTSTSFGRVNWGRLAWNNGASETPNAAFLANATVVELSDILSIENTATGRLEVAKLANPTSHADTGLFANFSTSFAMIFTPSLDGSEGLVRFAGSVNAFEKDGTFLSLPTASEGSLLQPATNSPFTSAGCIPGSSCFRPEYSQLDGAFFSGVSSSLFKVWGTTAPASAPPPFVSVFRGALASPTTAPVQTRQTSDNKELLYSFTDNSGDATGGYTIWLQLSGRAPPQPLLP